MAKRPRTMTRPQAAEELHCSVTKIARMIKAGQLTQVMVGDSPMITTASIDAIVPPLVEHEHVT